MEVLSDQEIVDMKARYVFKNKQFLKMSLSKIAIRNNFQIKVDRSDKKMYWTRCIDDKCQWFLCTRRVGKTEMFRVIKYQQVRTCPSEVIEVSHRQASALVISEYIKDNFADPKVTYRPSQII